MSTASPIAVMPHSEEAERSVIASVLLDNQQIHTVLELVTHEAFFVPRLRRIFRACERLHVDGAAIDLVTLRDRLETSAELDACGGVAFLGELLDGFAKSSNVAHYANIVKEKAVQRELLSSAQWILDNTAQAEGDTDSLLDEVEKRIFRLAQERLRSGFIPIRKSADESLKIIEDLSQRQEVVTGEATGFVELDEMTAGLQPSDLVILAARPSMGKTAFALNIAAHAALRHGRTIGIFSLEMSHQQLFMRMLCAESRVDAHRMRTGRIDDSDWQRLIRSFRELSETRVFIDDTPGVTILELRAKARRLQLEHGLDLLIIDYLQLMRGAGRYESRQQEISDISRSLKELAKELQVPVVALSQLSRATEQRSGDHRPQLSDLRESGAIEQDADVVMFLFREEVYDKDDPELKGKAELIIGKQRNGPVGTVPLVFLREHTRFENPEWRDF